MRIICARENRIYEKSLTRKEAIIKELTELKKQIFALEARFSVTELQSEIIKSYRETIKNYIEIVQRELATSLEEIKNLSQKLVQNINGSAQEMLAIIQLLYDTLGDLKKTGIDDQQKNLLSAKMKELEGLISQSKYLVVNEKTKGGNKSGR